MKKKVQQTAQPMPKIDENSASPDSDKESETGENRCRIKEYRSELNNLWDEIVQIKQTMEKKWESESNKVATSREILSSSIKETNITDAAVIIKKPKEITKQMPVNNNKKKPPVNNNKKKPPVVGNPKSEMSLNADSKNKNKLLTTAKLVRKNNNMKDISKKGL